ncbi:hypothetical protein, partial [Rhodopirellula sallentina]|uniref:hypothetical protein n=1 Tax=Rhodopirellula sallentina TaxID=1263869 RepID=UPI0011819A45
MNRKQSPRGIILLVVLSSLTFFSVLIAAYLVFSNQSRQSSFTISARNIHRPDVNGIIDDALMTLIRGTNVPTDPFYGEDLLSDYYGRLDAHDLTVGTVGTNIDGITKFEVTGLANRALDDLYAGRIITFTNGPLTNRSFRLLRSFHVTAGGTTTGHELVFEIGELPNPITGNTLRMNGVPRNSPGLGFDPATQTSTETTSSHAAVAGDTSFVGFDLPVALQPNHRIAVFDKSALTDLTSFRDLDEPYDAADFNNWFLSYRHEDGTVIPSFHRPSVVNYILNEVTPWSSATAAQQRNLFASLSRATFRPLPTHRSYLSSANSVNETFTGGNPNFALRVPLTIDTSAKLNQLARVLTGAATPSWDVDNDADGIPDSIWIDLGLPLITTPDGKLVRPLAAVMIEDLGGKLNINAHHNIAITATDAGVDSQNAEWAGTRNAFGNAANQRTAYRGLGYGPAEIAIPVPQLSNTIIGRYEDTVQFATAPEHVPGGSGVDDDASDIVLHGTRPQQHAFDNGYGMSIDPYGRGGLAVDRAGGLLLAEAGTTIRADDTMTTANELIDESINDPYEFDPRGNIAGDSALDLNDLEAILRSNFFDGENYSQTLSSPISGLSNYATLARQFTTISVSDSSPPLFELPASGASTPPSVYGSLANWLINTKSVPTTAVESLIAPELRLGNRIDVNRPFGNGVDNSSPVNGVIDEPSEVETNAFAIAAGSPTTTIPTNFDTAAPDYNFNDTLSARQLLAKHLYILMMALTDGKDLPVVDTGTVDADKFRANRLAQWAVNVVDFRDPDSIMTRFEYDPDPFDASGWMPTETVFGVEQPELLITETLAFHDVRVRDTDLDNGDGTEIGDAITPDDHSDQVRLPQGSLFVELLCPRTAPNDPITGTEDHRTKAGFPQELYDLTGTIPQLDLSREAPAGPMKTYGVPVWRLAISEPHFDAKPGEYAASGNELNDPLRLQNSDYESISFEPSELDPLNTAPSASLTLDRFMWFQPYSQANLTALFAETTIPSQDATNTFMSTSGSLLLSPGQYAVISPRTTTYLGSQTSTGALPEERSYQRFVSSASNGVLHYGLDDVAKMTTFTNTTKYTEALPIIGQTYRPTGWPATRFVDGLVGLNVSEPLPLSATYYPEPTAASYLSSDPTAFPVQDAYVDLASTTKTAIDEPVDLSRGRLPESSAPVGAGPEIALGTIPSYCSLFLQRLADPLSPYDSTANPYITVDWMTVDLNVFSGEEEISNIVTAATFSRRSRQKDGMIDGDRVNALYSYSTNAPDNPMTSVDETQQAYFAYPLNGTNASHYSSLGFLNTNETTANPGFEGFTDSIGSEAGSTAITGSERNFPRIPFAKHSWLNRPFATPFELMLVPASSPGRLFHEFTVAKGAAISVVDPVPTAMSPPALLTITAQDHGFQTGDTVKIEGVLRDPPVDGVYTVTVVDTDTFTLDSTSPSIPTEYTPGVGQATKIPTLFAAAATTDELVNFHAPFAHLLNFSHLPTNANDALNFSRIFDYVQTR